jgi:hypothetical protein
VYDRGADQLGRARRRPRALARAHRRDSARIRRILASRGLTTTVFMACSALCVQTQTTAAVRTWAHCLAVVCASRVGSPAAATRALAWRAAVPLAPMSAWVSDKVLSFYTLFLQARCATSHHSVRALVQSRDIHAELPVGPSSISAYLCTHPVVSCRVAAAGPVHPWSIQCDPRRCRAELPGCAIHASGHRSCASHQRAAVTTGPSSVRASARCSRGRHHPPADNSPRVAIHVHNTTLCAPLRTCGIVGSCSTAQHSTCSTAHVAQHAAQHAAQLAAQLMQHSGPRRWAR